MNNRERTRAILNYESYDRLPIVHFGFWNETLSKWVEEGHLTHQEIENWQDGTPGDAAIAKKLGFDFNWGNCFTPIIQMLPPFEEKILEEMPDGSYKVIDENGAIVIKKKGVTSIPTEIDHLLKGREEWEEIFLPRLQFSLERLKAVKVNSSTEALPFNEGGLDYLQRGEWEYPYGLFCGSLYGYIRNWLGLVGASYLQVDDPELFDEMIQTLGNLCYQITKAALDTGAQFDFGHFWEDISFRSGPLINPRVFSEKVGPHYKRITGLLSDYGINIVSVDSDGKIDKLVPIWLEKGVNTMFPIEVGVGKASIQPWREEYGRELRGVGGMNKNVFAQDYTAINTEIERLKPLVELGGYIPCPDHRIAPDAKWKNVQYYCHKMRQTFGQ
ncbi:MAG: hypothetical protein QGG48_06115 [Desulfatiglandales bacterium]|nr:hypothetical protein [Desulfatiglandales bacterium]